MRKNLRMFKECRALSFGISRLCLKFWIFILKCVCCDILSIPCMSLHVKNKWQINRIIRGQILLMQSPSQIFNELKIVSNHVKQSIIKKFYFLIFAYRKGNYISPLVFPPITLRYKNLFVPIACSSLAATLVHSITALPYAILMKEDENSY